MTGSVDGGADRDVLSGVQNLTGLTISPVEVLETQFSSVIGTVEQLERFDRIVVSDQTEAARVSLILSNSGTLDLSDELEGQRGARVFASSAGAFDAAGQIRVVQDNGRTVIQANLDGDFATVEFEIELTRANVALSATDFVL